MKTLFGQTGPPEPEGTEGQHPPLYPFYFWNISRFLTKTYVVRAEISKSYLHERFSLQYAFSLKVVSAAL